MTNGDDDSVGSQANATPSKRVKTTREGSELGSAKKRLKTVALS